MDWEGGTIGAIVPALMGHGEAGRASPWPFFFAHVVDPIADVSARRNSHERQPPEHRLGGCFRCWHARGHRCAKRTVGRSTLPSRTSVIGRPVFESYSSAGIDAQVVVEAGRDIVGRDSFVSRARRGVIAFPDHLTATNRTAGHQHEHAAGIVVAAAFGTPRD